ncbi:primosomal protein N' [Ferrovibrio sp.]|uniref:primosomal protein N' n=1 Tax=Ferrovibrio sp. TaxID=1917215 RepID=UPI0025C170A8|nr:primosomal protein N' [Ferrovibrio sp.]MBX3456450.1 primosomal protein N' [Ferrovibrio sp.]
MSAQGFFDTGILRVLLPVPLGRPLSYAAPGSGPSSGPGSGPGFGEMPQPGSLVRVSLSGRELVGVVWDGEAETLPPDKKLKQVAEVYRTPPLSAPLRRLVDWVAAYTLNTPGMVLRMCLPMPEALTQPPPSRQVLHIAQPQPDLRPNAQRSRVLAIAAERPGLSQSELAEAAGVGAAVVRRLVELGALRALSVSADSRRSEPDGDAAGPHLSEDQQAAAQTLCKAVAARQFSVALLQGVTGSGKTEVYFEAVAEALRMGRQCLVLLPEIALTQAWLDRFERRFGGQAWAWHSELSPGRRAETLRAITSGRARVVVGARSALFLPFADLGMIVVDEEHDASYKQEEGAIYNARDMAVVRAKLESVPIVLASATPSLESLYNARRGRYAHLLLPQRHGTAEMPKVFAIDMRKHPPASQHFISAPLRVAIEKTLAEGEQAMLFLNRRGYAPLTLCGACGHRLECPNCSAWLVEHKARGRLLCHHCGFQARLPDACPACGETHRFKPCGPGVERLAEEAATLFPEARLALMTSDTMTSPQQITEMLRRVEDRAVDILVGTQIVAKGHHFPMLTLVGVIDADLGLAGGDPRAAERTWQLLTQVAGRAGRAERPGSVLLQSYEPTHPVIAALARHDTEGFLLAELAERERGGMPPFGRLAALIISGADAAQVGQAGRLLAQAAPMAHGLRVLGPAPAPLSFLRGKHRERLLLKATRDIDTAKCIAEWLGRVKLPSGVRLAVDIDPYSFL